MSLCQVGDQQGVCDMISLCILIISWAVPVLRKSSKVITDFEQTH
jgi:hypothetical protein